MRPDQHLRNAAQWQAKAPPIAVRSEQTESSVVIRFPIERIREAKRG